MTAPEKLIFKISVNQEDSEVLSCKCNDVYALWKKCARDEQHTTNFACWMIGLRNERPFAFRFMQSAYENFSKGKDLK